MGGTFKKIEFVERDSDYPTRRKLKPVDETNHIYDVTREEGNVRVQGTAFTANLMTQFQTNIDNMFPVTVANGGTGATTLAGARNALGLGIESGSFSNTLGIYNNASTREKIELASTSIISARYYKIANLVHCNIRFLSTSAQNSKNYNSSLIIGPLPYTVYSTEPVTVGRFSISGVGAFDARAYIQGGDKYIYITKGSNGTNVPVSDWVSNTYRRMLTAYLGVTYSLI